MPGRKIQRQARTVARAQTAPARREIKRQKQSAKRTARRTAAASQSQAEALQNALRVASRNIKHTKGLSARDASIALAELAQRRVDAQAGAVLSQRASQADLRDTMHDLNAQLSDVAAQKGEIQASTAVDLAQAAKSNRISKANLEISREGLEIDKAAEARLEAADHRDARADRFERKHGGRTPDEVSSDQKEKLGEVKATFKKALATVKSGGLTVTTNQANAEEGPSTGVKDTTSVTAQITKEIAGANPTKAKQLISAKLTEGNKDLANVVYDRWMGSRPTKPSLGVIRRYGYNFGWSPVEVREALHVGG